LQCVGCLRVTCHPAVFVCITRIPAVELPQFKYTSPARMFSGLLQFISRRATQDENDISINQSINQSIKINLNTFV